MRTLTFEENHIHSTYSDGSRTLAELVAYNKTHDALDLTFADHVDKKTRWFGRYVQKLRQLRRKERDFTIRIGCEVKILDDGTLNTTPTILRQAEVVLGSVHFFNGIHTMDKQSLLQREFELTQRLAQHPDIDILAHPFSMSQRFYDIDPPRAYVEQILRLCIKNGVQFEYNAKHALANTRSVLAQFLRNPHNRKHISFGSDVHESASEIGDAAFHPASPVTVLVTGAGAGVGQSVIKAVKLSKVPTRIIAVDHDIMAAGLYRGDVAYDIPLARSRAFIDRLIAICKREGVELLLIGTDVELEAISRHQSRFERIGVHVVVSPLRAVSIADDKWRTVQFLKRNSFAYPDSCLPKDVQSFVKRHGFPVIVKPRVSARSIGFSVVHNEHELNEKLAAIEHPIIQEYLTKDDQEYTCGTMVYRGRGYGAITMKRWLRSGDTYKAVVERNPRMETYVAAVSKKLKVEGPCNLQLRRAGSKYKIFEINCRFSGTTATQSFLGFNVANILLQHLFFARKLRPLSFTPSVMMRYWNELFISREQVNEIRKQHRLRKPQSQLNVF